MIGSPTVTKNAVLKVVNISTKKNESNRKKRAIPIEIRLHMDSWL